MRSVKIWQSKIKKKIFLFNNLFCFILLVLFKFLHFVSCHSFKKEVLFTDAKLSDYETVLTTADFKLATQINNNFIQNNNVDGLDDVWDSYAMYNTDKFEGDIANNLNASMVEVFLLGASLNSNSTQFNAIRDRRQLWTNGRIPYAISSQYSSYSRAVIALAMQEYFEKTCIQWSPKTETDYDYVYILPDKGCYSLVGRAGGKQILSLGNGCIQKGVIIHEMMHTVGFFHEQARTDRDNHVKILWQNILPGMEGQFEKYSNFLIQTFGTQYDYASIMHYGSNAFTRNGLPTIVPRRQATIGQRTGFSNLDSYKINVLYNCPNYNKIKKIVFSKISSKLPNYISTSTQVLPNSSITKKQSKSEIVVLCINKHPDCYKLAHKGFCIKNSTWMRENCPFICRMCKIGKEKKFSTLSILQQSFSTVKSITTNICEDLRVDCAELAKRRYCITAQSFTRIYCARSCGFCFYTLSTEFPSASKLNFTTPNTISKFSIATFWPKLQPITKLSHNLSLKLTNLNCKNQKFFCTAWKKAGFCQGIFTSYMKKNCPLICGWC